jgi:hypothetical protein
MDSCIRLFRTLHPTSHRMGKWVKATDNPSDGTIMLTFWHLDSRSMFRRCSGRHWPNRILAITAPATRRRYSHYRWPTPYPIPAVAVDPLSAESVQHIAQIQDAHVLVAEAGRHRRNSRTKDIETQEHAPWIVRAQRLKFRIQSLFPIGRALANEQVTTQSPNQHIYLKPMHLVSNSDAKKDHSIESTLTITITGPEGLGIFKCEPVIKKVPKTLLGDCVFIWIQIFEQLD